MLKDQVDLQTALQEVARFAGISTTPMTPQVRAKVAARRQLEETLAIAMRHFEARLWETASALEYCRWRGWDDATIKAHHLGYSDGSLRTALAGAGIDVNGKEAKAALSIPRGMLVYAHLEFGRVMYLSGRLADRERKRHYNPPSQLIGSRQPYWNASQGDEVVVIEGQADAVTLGQWGIPAVGLAGCGLTATVGQHLVRRLERTQQVYIWPDADGRTDVASLAGELGPMVRVIAGPEGVKDANQWLQEGATAKRALDLMGEATTWMVLLIEEAARTKEENALKAVMQAFGALDVWGQAAWRRRICRSLDLTVEEMRAMVRAVQEEEETGPLQQDAYTTQQGMFCRVVHNDAGTFYRALSNFTAEIVEDILEDDGEETERRFVVQGALASGVHLPRVEVEAGEFAQMRWMAQQWGAKAAVAAGSAARDHLRASIQVLSQNVKLRHEYSHLGWRESNGQRFYLSAAGAVGRDGVQVRFIHDLANYRLPTTPNETRAAMEASLRFLEIGDYHVTVPLWTAMFLAPLASIVPPSFTIWLYGTTGSLKSTVTALAMCHYGQFSYNSPPASWTGTVNALEKKAFLVKDAPLWIDDYTAQTTIRGMNEIRRKADQLLRDWGNRTGRSRMQSNLRLRRTFVPRGLIISTAEQLPPGQSILARLYAIEVHPGLITGGAGSALTRAQLDECQLYPHAMAGYLLWLAERWADLEGPLREKQRRYMEAARAEGEHLRMPGNVATMFLGFEMGLTYAQEVGALSEAGAQALREDGWRELLGIGEEQHRVVAGENPVELYLDALEQMLAMGVIYLRHKDFPDVGEKIRPKQKTLSAEFLGWYDDNFWYLLPKAAYNSVVQFYRAGGTVFPDSVHGVKTKLDEQGLLLRQGGRFTYRLRTGNEQPRVLRIAFAKRFEVMENIGNTGNTGNNGTIEDI